VKIEKKKKKDSMGLESSKTGPTIWIMARLLLSSSVRDRYSDYANVIANVACPTNACKHWISFVARVLMRPLQMLMCVLIMFRFANISPMTLAALFELANQGTTRLAI
jgi:hypothetical protein